MNENYSVRQIAKMLRITEEQVRRWIRNTELVGKRESKKQGYRVSESDLEDFLRRNPKYKRGPLVDESLMDKRRIISELERELHYIHEAISTLSHTCEQLESTIIKLKEELV